MISREEIKELQDIAGKEWVSTDPCMMDSYSLYMNPETINSDGSLWLPRPAAVVLPASTEEVQAIMRFCNKSDLMVKPISTGFHAVSAASRERVIVLDLKRMNRIIDIDVKNQIAVIEPYVRAIDLQTELFKHGLNVHIVSCGSNHSVLASTAAAWGYGMSGPSTSFSGRNLLGVEWVLPTGEAYIMGSKGSGCGWFTAEGPGPSMRGIMRGFQGTFGCLGVFTKCAVKLYKWDGPSSWKVLGESPNYLIDQKPPRMSMNILSFPTGKAMKDAGYLLGEAELDFAQFRTPMFFSALAMTENNEELKLALESGLFQKIMQWTLCNVVTGNSDREYSWRMKALKEVLRETGGVLVPMNLKVTPGMLSIISKFVKYIKDPLYLLRKFPFLQTIAHKIPVGKKQKHIQFSRLFWLFIRNAVNTQSSFRPTQGMSTCMGSFDTWDLGVEQSDWIAVEKQEYIKKGLILDDGGDMGCGGIFEGGHLGYLEGIILYNTREPGSIIAAGDLIDKGVKASIDNALGVPIAGFGSEMNSRFGPGCGNYNIWMSRIKKALDPNRASDPFFYSEPKEDND